MGKTSARITLLLLSALLAPSIAQAQDAGSAAIAQNDAPALPSPADTPAAEPVTLAPVSATPAAAPSRSSDELPRIIDDDGQKMPLGYRATKRARPGLVLTGSLIFGIPYMISATAALSSRDGEDAILLLPFLGPLLHSDARTNCNAMHSRCTDSRDIMQVNAVMQGAGLLLLGLSIALPKRVFVRDGGTSAVTVSATPVSFGKGASGLGVVGSF